MSKVYRNNTPWNSKYQQPKDLKTSPNNNGNNWWGNAGISVNLIKWPCVKEMEEILTKFALVPTGGCLDTNEEIIEKFSKTLFEGGIQQGLEAFNFVFELNGISRALTHQLVRTRNAVFAQQTMRYTYYGDNFDVRIPDTVIQAGLSKEAVEFVDEARKFYKKLYDADIPFQDCRYFVPIGITNYIYCTYNVKEFLNLYSYRACPMFMPEMVYVMNKMRDEVIRKLPQMGKYIKISCEKTKKCMYQGYESKTDRACNFEWNATRVFKSELIKNQDNLDKE